MFSENEKARRWEEIKIRQHRLQVETEQTTPAHIEQIMKSGFTMSDIKGLHRGYSEDGVEADEVMAPRGKSSLRPSRPPRKGSLSRTDDMGQINGPLDPNSASY
jgi:ryanodine receptor 2